MTVVACLISKNDWDHQLGGMNGFSTAGSRHRAEETGPSAGAWEPVVHKILDFEHLSDDWDGLGAIAPTRELLESVIGLARLFSEKGVNPPHCVVSGVDGSVSFEWQDPDGTYAEVEIVRPFHAEVMVIEPGKPARHWTLPTD